MNAKGLLLGLHLAGNHLQIHVGSISRNPKIGSVSREPSTVATEQHQRKSEQRAERNECPQQVLCIIGQRRRAQLQLAG